MSKDNWPARQSERSKRRHLNKTPFSLSWLSRWRWNLIDLVQICNRGSVATYLFCDIDMSWAEKLQTELLDKGFKITVTALLIKAIGLAQLKHPESRTIWLPWGRVATLNNICAGFTVEKVVEGESAVYFGTIQKPHLKSVAEIASELSEYSRRKPEEIPQLEIEHRFAKMPWLIRRLILLTGLSLPAIRLKYLGATFGISSLGKYGMKVLIPPCACTCTFGVGSVEDTPVVREGQIVVRPIMNLILNFDHRLIDGAPAARFLSDVRSLLEGGLVKYLEKADQTRAGTPRIDGVKIHSNSVTAV